MDVDFCVLFHELHFLGPKTPRNSDERTFHLKKVMLFLPVFLLIFDDYG
ncbi:hypothetical protein NC99_02130 [Sunxiuqinia dokdonensis]|uniref:Uncharacterized protein n=1 Tax=Sunxiuqinia dokdonensis TaxID=1409788 RepID=A0A0L8VET1_9BACT|nr:hypothetical protein NC99_02130 [Sunxiuqinia dokdonensis]